MSPAELLDLLYKEADKNLKLAELALNDKEYDSFDKALTKTTQIVRYLNTILDTKYPLAANLRNIYNYLIYDLSRVKAGRERRQEEIGRMIHILGELREGFSEAANNLNKTHSYRDQGV